MSNESNYPERAFWISFALAGLALTIFGAYRFAGTTDGRNFILTAALGFVIAALPWISKLRIKGLLEIDRTINKLRNETSEKIKETDNRMRDRLDTVQSNIMNTLNTINVQMSQQNSVQSAALRSSNIISIGSTLSINFEDAKASEFKTDWLDGKGADFRSLMPTEDPSQPAALIEKISEAEHMDYMIVDVGDGKKWLSSRLFLFAAMLERMLELRCIVFLGTRNDVTRRYLGLASAEKVISTLINEYPWLERAYSWAHCQTRFSNPFAESNMPSVISKYDSTLVEGLVFDFLKNPNVQLPEIPPEESQKWVPLERKDGTKIWEHTQWLTPSLVDKLFEKVLNRTSVIFDNPDLSRPQKSRSILRRSGSFVAMIDIEHRFKELIDRQALLESIAIRLTENSEESSIDSGAMPET